MRYMNKFSNLRYRRNAKNKTESESVTPVGPENGFFGFLLNGSSDFPNSHSTNGNAAAVKGAKMETFFRLN